MYNKKFIVMRYNSKQKGEWTVIYSTDDFQEAYGAVSLYYPANTVMIVSPVKYTVIEDDRQLDLFEEAQT